MRFRLSWIAFFLALNALATFLVAFMIWWCCFYGHREPPLRTSYLEPGTAHIYTPPPHLEPWTKYADVTAAYQEDVHSVPEPGTLALVGAGGVGLLLKWRSK